jgi:PAS domain S-box-containing protein
VGKWYIRTAGGGVQELLDGLPDAIVAVDTAGRVLYLNRAAETLLGYSRDELIGQPADRLLPERMRPRGYRKMADELHDGRAISISALHKQGIEIEVDLTASVVGEVTVASLRRRREMVQVAADQVYRLVFDNAPIGIWHFDAHGVITACNDKFASIIGSPARVLVGLGMLSLPDSRIVYCVQAALRGDLSRFEGEYTSATSGKVTTVKVDFTPIFGTLPDGTRAVLGGVGLAEDISEREAAQVALRRSEASFRALIESAPDAVAVYRSDGRFIYVNPALLRILGYEKPDELLGRPALEVLHPDERRAFGAEWLKPEQSDGPLREARFLRKDGRPVLAELEARAIHFDGGDAIIVLGRDITERKQLLQRLAQADRMASVGTLAAGIAHEINNPLAYVMASLDLTKRKLELLSSGRAALEATLTQVTSALNNAREGTERVSTIVRDLRTFSRADPNRRVLVDVEAVIDSAANMAWAEIGRRARLVKDYGGVSSVWGDEARLGQVFLNLLINAAHSISIGEGDATQNEIRVTTRDLDDERVIVEVVDTGSGIPPEMIGRIFEPFVTTKPIGEGTGLGLSICHGIVTSLGGEITVQSEMSRGSLFRVTLPSGAQPARAGRARVLLVAPSLPPALAELGARHEVVVAGSAAEATELLLHDDRFDLVLCDPSLELLKSEIAKLRPGVDQRFARLGRSFGVAEIEALLNRRTRAAR